MDTLKLMLKFIVIFVGIVGAIIGLISLIAYLFNTDGPFGEYMLYRKTKDNTFYAKDYIEKYPGGKYINEVRLSYSNGIFIEAKNIALDTNYLESNDNCLKLFEFIHNFKDAPDYLEALKLAEEYGYTNYFRLRDWSRINDYITVFPQSVHSKEFTILKDKSIDSALLKIEQLSKNRELNKNQSELLKAILIGSKNQSRPLAICLNIVPDIRIGNPEQYKQFKFEGKIVRTADISSNKLSFAYFSDFLLKKSIHDRLFENLSKLLPGKNFFSFDTLKKENIPVFEIKCKVSPFLLDGNSTNQIPYIGEYFEARYPTKTVTSTKRVSEYSKVQKEWIYKNVTETKIETDYSSPAHYEHAGYYFHLIYDITCELLVPGNDEIYKVDLVYRTKTEEITGSQPIHTVYDNLTNEAVQAFATKLIPDFEYDKHQRAIQDAQLKLDKLLKENNLNNI